MTAQNDRFWAKVLFSQFIKHFRKMDDAQIVADIKQSMDDLEDLNDSGTSFGSKMVKWSMERADEPFAQAARENGKKGGRPRKKSGPMPEDKELVYEFASQEGLDSSDAYNCWYATVQERDGRDMDGRPVEDWKAFVRQWCMTARANRKRLGG